MTKQNLEKCLIDWMENNPSKTPTTSRLNSRTAIVLVSAGQEDVIQAKWFGLRLRAI